jgi:hypothetical protein
MNLRAAVVIAYAPPMGQFFIVPQSELVTLADYVATLRGPRLSQSKEQPLVVLPATGGPLILLIDRSGSPARPDLQELLAEAIARSAQAAGRELAIYGYSSDASGLPDERVEIKEIPDCVPDWDVTLYQFKSLASSSLESLGALTRTGNGGTTTREAIEYTAHVFGPEATIVVMTDAGQTRPEQLGARIDALRKGGQKIGVLLELDHKTLLPTRRHASNTSFGAQGYVEFDPSGAIEDQLAAFTELMTLIEGPALTQPKLADAEPAELETDLSASSSGDSSIEL